MCCLEKLLVFIVKIIRNIRTLWTEWRVFSVAVGGTNNYLWALVNSREIDSCSSSNHERFSVLVIFYAIGGNQF
jgi:hypothetical protein